MIHNYAVSNREEMQVEVDYLTKYSIYGDEDIAIMPDGHLGKSHSCVGFVSTYHDKIIPNTVGVDICCRVTLFNIEGDINLKKLDEVIHANIPSGNSIRQSEAVESRSFPYEQLRCWDAIKDGEDRYRRSMGTLGGGKMRDCLRAA